MAVTWNIASLDATKTEESLSDVIKTVHWTASDSDGDHKGYSYGSVALKEADPTSFIAYKDVTKDNVIAWVKALLGTDEVTRIETEIATQITRSKTPTTTTGVPW
tara:strand:+ start:198 stop:512 length:315 start_codon:yes stop_codon:yes gene_type:complete